MNRDESLLDAVYGSAINEWKTNKEEPDEETNVIMAEYWLTDKEIDYHFAERHDGKWMFLNSTVELIWNTVIRWRKSER